MKNLLIKKIFLWIRANKFRAVLLIFVGVPLLYNLTLRGIDAFIRRDLPEVRTRHGHWDGGTWGMSANAAIGYISDCKRFPDSYKSLYIADRDKETNEVICEREAGWNFKKYATPWLDYWGRPYQIRYDLERRKLQVRSQGRFLWNPWDDYWEEIPFDGKFYKAQVKYCETVPNSDMNCVFNRGWH